MLPDFMTIASIILFRVLMVALPVGVLIGAGIWFFRRSALGRSVLDRVQDGAADKELLQSLASEVEYLHHEMTELQERVDFAERRLAQPAIEPREPASRARPRTPPEPAQSV